MKIEVQIMFNKYTNKIEVIKKNDSEIQLFLNEELKLVDIQFDHLKLNEPCKLAFFDDVDQIILNNTPSDSFSISVYIFDKHLYAIKESLIIEQSVSTYHSTFRINILNRYEELKLVRLGVYKIALINAKGELIKVVDDLITNTNSKELIKIDYDLDAEPIESKNTSTIAIASYGKFHLVITYNFAEKVISIRKVIINKIKIHEDIEVKLYSHKEILISTPENELLVNFKKMKKGHKKKICPVNSISNSANENIVSIISINNARYYFYTIGKSIFISKSDPFTITGFKANLKVLLTSKKLFFFGRYTHYAKNANGKYQTLYLKNSDHKLAEFVRPFKSIPLLRRYGYFKVNLDDLFINDKIHNNFFMGDSENHIHNLKLKYNDKKVKTIAFKKNGDQLNVIRTNLKGDVASTIVPFSEEYLFSNRFKIKIAKLLSMLSQKKKRNVNLYFEKKSDKADESSIRVFEEVMKKETIKSKNYYVINGKVDKYTELKLKYGANIIKKYSIKHYYSIYLADYFISSELSNHLLNDRLYIDSLRNRIMEVPLVFLQHGIMFAKPVDNPMAFGFHKDKNLYNMYKSVISSELEAGEFSKMGYDNNDLILTGLATFDYAKLNDTADKIAFMPTYRYWEEGLIYNNEIEQTSYYNCIMRVIEKFEEENLIDRLLIVPHNKFSQFISNNMPQYKNIISDNPSEALKESVIFITDYSSAIYDAIYRGAYPIFHWEEKDFLIEKYKAIPPVNEDNAPGPISFDSDELMDHVKKALNNNYVLEEEYLQKYRMINQFNDGGNTKRIVDFLIEDKIL